MKSLRLTLNLIKIPKLFGSLLFWPMIIGLLVAFFQVFATSTYIRLTKESSTEFQKRMEEPDHIIDWLKKKVYQGNVPPKNASIIRVLDETSLDKSSLKDSDIAFQVQDPHTFDVTDYLEMFASTVYHINVCKNCVAGITINLKNKKPILSIRSFKAYFTYAFAETNVEDQMRATLVNTHQVKDRFEELRGTVLFFTPGFDQAIDISHTTSVMFLVINIAFLVLVALWLLIAGHRRVLQYFAKNDALLPLVAACGKKEFYRSLWLITSLRVFLFLASSIPTTYIFYTQSIPIEILSIFIRSKFEFLCWILAIVSSLSLMSIIASVSELKQRHGNFSFVYKFISPVLFFIGTVLWVGSIFFDSSWTYQLQYLVTLIPVFGVCPVILSPLFPLDAHVLLIHSLIALIIVALIMRSNVKWFAAHLEEV